jgi:acyl phosphate:glycerol-3-phosphate acyltransferase
VTTPVIAVAGVLAGAYVVGSVPVAWLLGRSRDIDLREVGSGNPGTSNLFRNAGIGMAVLSGPLQFAQGLVPVLIARAAGGEGSLVELTALVTVAGNGWPVWLGFRGQRGVAVATGAVAGLHPVLLAVLLVCFAAGAVGRRIAAGVLAGFVLLPVAAAFIGGPGLAVTCSALLATLLLRRLDGIGDDRRRATTGERRHILVRRIVFDERPGQVLVGRRPGAKWAERRP